MNKLLGYLRLMRPANIVTAFADIMAGFAISGMISPSFISNGINSIDLYILTHLLLSTLGLYGGGVVFNDVFDAELDKIERPERPIPRGVISKWEAALLGSILLLIGVFFAFKVSDTSGFIAIGIAALALIYDKFSKHYDILGPVNMGSCRGLNLLLGASAVPGVLSNFWYIAFIPIIYIGAITMISKGEVKGGNTKNLKFAVFLYSLVIISILFLNFTFAESILNGLVFTSLFAFIIFKTLFRAIENPEPANIRQAVKTGVLSLIIMDAALAVGFAGLLFALLILLLLPISILLGKVFAVT